MIKNKKNTVYLAGGFHSNWQEKVILSLKGWTVHDPSSHNIQNPSEYTDWDLKAIQNSDVILAYMEKDNPGGYALALEIGYAKALGKKILLVEEHKDKDRQKYFEMVRAVADCTFPDIDNAIKYLAKIN